MGQTMMTPGADKPSKRSLIEGRVLVERLTARGRVVETRHVVNTVMRSGAELVAALFRGESTTPVDGMAVGVDASPATAPYEISRLRTTAPDGTTLLDRPAVALAADALRTEVLTGEMKVRVSVRGVLPPDRAVSPDDGVDRVEVAEAALGVLASDGTSLERIYNRVTFEPLPKRRDEELAFYWEVDFPYGA